MIYLYWFLFVINLTFAIYPPTEWYTVMGASIMGTTLWYYYFPLKAHKD